METKLLNALVAHYQAELQRGEANLICFFKNASGVGDHPDIIGEMTKLVDTIAHARMSLQVLNDMVQQEPAQTPAAADD
tara:strand:+ start:230 stop:466 length:237 start_codon:yes stop_codon:yes gene_type:complete